MGEPAGPVLAVVDRDACSMAAVRRALPLARDGALPLIVVYLYPSPSTFSTMYVPESAFTYEEMHEVVFAETAEILAPTGLAWDFHMVRPSRRQGRLYRLATAARAGAVVLAGHRTGHPLAAVRRLRESPGTARLRTASIVIVADCDRAEQTPVPRTSLNGV